MPQQASITNRDSPYTAVIRKPTEPGTGHRSSETHPKVQIRIGLGKKESCAGNLFAYGDHLYIGGYNDPMLDLAEIGNAGDFQSLYEDLKNPACLNRMDKNENIELINDDGFGAAPHSICGDSLNTTESS